MANERKFVRESNFGSTLGERSNPSPNARSLPACHSFAILINPASQNAPLGLDFIGSQRIVITRSVKVDNIAGLFIKQRVYREECIFADTWKLHVAINGRISRDPDDFFLGTHAQYSG